MEDHKVYLSYHHDDNLSIDENDRGWVENLTRLLNMMYSQLYDQNLSFCNAKGTDNYMKTRFSNTEAVLLILSPNYMQDAECKEELKQISSSVDTEKIFKVIKYPITDFPLNGLTDLTNYDFFALNRETGEVRTYQNLIDTNLEGSVWMKVMDMAEDLHHSLSNEKGGNTTTDRDEQKVTIYLADTGNLLSVERNIIKRELSRYGFDISPKTSLPKDQNKAKEVIHKELKDCDISIHLIDNKQYIGKDNSHWDLAMIQNELAMEKFDSEKSKRFSRLIWIPQAEEEQESDFTSAGDELEFTRNAEVLQSSIEDLKNVLKNNLVLQSENLGEVSELSMGGAKKVYLIYDQADEKEISVIINKIKEQGFDVMLPSFDRDLIGVRDKHISSLRECDIATIHYTTSDPIWLRMKFLDLVKSPGLGRTKGPLPKVILHSSKAGFDKKFFAKHDTYFHSLEEDKPFTFLKNLINNPN